MSNPCLYVFVNTDLESMNFGKAMAQSSHVANAFVCHAIIDHELLIDPTNIVYDLQQAAVDWYKSTPQGFGTQSNLKSNDFMNDLYKIETAADINQWMFGQVVDPTYPFEVSKEIFELLDKSKIVSSFVKGDGKVLCTRAEITGFYVFGDRDDPEFKSFMRQWKLHP
jgi:hypothetical protein